MYFDYCTLLWFKKLFIVLMYINTVIAVASENITSPKELFNESLDLHKQGKVVEAINKLEQLEKIDPNNPNVIANIAQFSGEAGLPEKATKYFAKLIQLEPNNIQAEAGYALYQSINLANGEKFEDAVNLLENIVHKVPNHGSILWNLASFSAEAEKHEKALKYWSHLAKIEPKNMHIQSKIIQSYQALNDIKNREQAIDKIMAMYKDNNDKNYIKQNIFCREQYKVGTWKVFVFQYFNPGKEDQYFYRYSVTDKTGSERFWLSLGSYQSTTEFARETGSISTTGRMYHLDYYDKAIHSTQGMYPSKPTYDELKEVTRKYIIQAVDKMRDNNLTSTSTD